MNAIEKLKTSENFIKERFGVERIGIFGSYARGEETSSSDVDVLVEFEQGRKTFDNFIELKFFLEDLFGRSVDLVTIQALKPQLKDSILHEVQYA